MKETMSSTIGIADTMFARYDMAGLAEKTIKEHAPGMKIVRYTVPGVKDLPVACKRLFERYECDIVIALGMAGAKPVDKQCAHEASTGIIKVQLLENKHILEVFVHEDEAENDKDLLKIFKNRTAKHSLNAIALLKGKDELRPWAGKGIRQGSEDAGPIKEEQEE